MSEKNQTETVEIVDAPTTEEVKTATKKAKAAKKAKANEAKPSALTVVIPEVTERVHPDNVVLGRNSRIVAAPNQDAIDQERAVSIHLHGQFQPVAGHRDAAGNIVIDDGFTRHRAVKLLRKGFKAVDTTTGRDKEFRDENALLWVAIDPKVTTDEEAFAKSLRSNHERADTTDLQDALAQQVLRDEFGWNKTRIAREYGYENTNRVARLEELLELPEWVRDLVHAENISLTAALDTKPLKDETRKTVIEKATDAKTGKVDGAKVRSLIRDLATTNASTGAAIGEDGETGEETETPASSFTGSGGAAVKIKRTTTEFKNFCAEVTDENTALAAEIKTLFGYFTEWFDGTRADKSLWNGINAINEKVSKKK